jgi:hypothetical protein
MMPFLRIGRTFLNGWVGDSVRFNGTAFMAQSLALKCEDLVLTVSF